MGDKKSIEIIGLYHDSILSDNLVTRLRALKDVVKILKDEGFKEKRGFWKNPLKPKLSLDEQIFAFISSGSEFEYGSKEHNISSYRQGVVRVILEYYSPEVEIPVSLKDKLELWRKKYNPN